MNSRLELKIKKNGYEFTLIECDRKGLQPQPAFLGIGNYALKSCKKINGKSNLPAIDSISAVATKQDLTDMCEEYHRN